MIHNKESIIDKLKIDVYDLIKKKSILEHEFNLISEDIKNKNIAISTLEKEILLNETVLEENNLTIELQDKR